MLNDIKGSKELLKEVIESGLCTLCGACAGSCPYLVTHKGKPVLVDNCLLDDGECYQYCPRTLTDMSAISTHVFGVPYSDDEIGTAKEVLVARSTDVRIKERAQYGGTVTTLLSLALSEGLIDGAVVAGMSEEKIPAGLIAKSAEAILEHAGSSYMACPVLEAYNRVPMDEDCRLGIVTLPCQALALRKMQADPPQNRFNIANVKLIIGLFCTWALSPDGFHRFLKENLDLTQVKKFDIPPPPASEFNVYSDAGKTSLPLDEIRKYIMSGCHYCPDMTAEFADISVGAAEGIEGWNTVIVRTDAGAELMGIARDKGKLEVDVLPPQNLAHLKEASLLKKKRALAEIINKSGDKSNLLYLGLPKDVVDNLLR